ncbi:hypothetical protein SLEP1_g381 [Rubroshorea leprosula]|uniref:Phosphate transporter n=1 Tax=Rubroshorea leprosula TaxID=152421 RepID=A0AAV5HHC7_9ROSI|nr:hypothetical protein SLEP1_g381 [Rubroshorea leprosula]
MGREQMGVLNAIDVAKTQWYHFTAIVITGMGFFTDAYDLFSISLVTKLLGRIYYYTEGQVKPSTLPINVLAAVNGVALCGTLAGQLFFGWLGDKMGRKTVYGLTLLLMVLCSIGSGLSFGRDAKNLPSCLNMQTNGLVARLMPQFFAMQGFGILAAGIVSLVVSAAFNSAFPAPTFKVNTKLSTVPEADYVWRIIVMFGANPASLTYYWRMKMPETARYTALVAKNLKQADADMSKVLHVDLEVEQGKGANIANTDKGNSFGLFSTEFIQRHGLHLSGTTTTWFLLDIAYYSQNLYQKDIFHLHVCFAIPYQHWKLHNPMGFLGMYSLTFFFENFGPNSTTFIVPAEIFPARLRSTCHGISAAAGKAGAIVGAFGFLYASQDPQQSLRDNPMHPKGLGMQRALLLLGCVNALGMLFTILVPEPKGKSLEELSGESEAENGAMEMHDRPAPPETYPIFLLHPHKFSSLIFC